MTEKRPEDSAPALAAVTDIAGVSAKRNPRVAGGVKRTPDLLPKERTITLYLDDEELVAFQASPEHLDELAVGFLYGEGLLDGNKDLKEVRVKGSRISIATHSDRPSIEKLGGKRTLTSGCGRGLTFLGADSLTKMRRVDGALSISKTQIGKLMRELSQRSIEYQKTGGIHSSALATPDRIIAVREDIGRHNTIDKLIGHALLEEVDLRSMVLVSSGRISLEMAAKAVRAQTPIVISRTAATDMAVALAEELGLTLVGYARAPLTDKMNVYSGVWRLEEGSLP